VGETVDSVGHFFVNLMAGKLDTEVSANPHLFYSEVPHHTNHSTVARFVNDKLKCGGLPEFTRRRC
jgi:hypothetical protein